MEQLYKDARTLERMRACLLGAYVEVEKPVTIETLKEVVRKNFTGRRAELLEVNLKAIEEGSKFAKEFLGV